VQADFSGRGRSYEETEHFLRVKLEMLGWGIFFFFLAIDHIPVLPMV